MADTAATPEPAEKTAPIAWPNRRVRTPTVLQMEAVECGAASLAMILGSFGRYVPLEELRVRCGVSRDGSKAANVLRAARSYGLVARGFKNELSDLATVALPAIIFWEFNHFVVLEGFRRGKVFVNDPAQGPRTISDADLDRSFTGVVLTFEKGPEFTPGGRPRSLMPALIRRLRGSGSALSFAVLAGLGLVIPGLAIPTFTQVFVDEVLVQRVNGWLMPLLAGMALTALLRGALVWLQSACLLRLQTKVSLSSSSRFFQHVLRLPMDFFNQRWAGEIGGRVQLNDRIAGVVSGQFAGNAISLVTLVFYAAVMLSYDVVLTLFGVAFAALNVFALQVVSRRRVDMVQRAQLASGQAGAAAMGGIQMMEDLKASGTETAFFVDWAGRYAKAMNAAAESGVYSTYLQFIPALLSTLNSVAVLGVGGLRVMDGHLSVGMLVAFQSLMASFMGPVQNLLALGSTLQEVQSDMNRLDDVLGHKTDPQLQPENADDAAASIVRLSGRVELKNVTFGYSRLDPPLVADLNLTLEPGSRVALVGGSGSGKSTIAKLVCGLYEPWSGEILFDGRPRRDTPRDVITNSLGLVDQDIFLFGHTIRECLTMWDSTIPESQILQAASDACIHDDIVVRSSGYDSPMDEGGLNFSGGQRQRLEIARALVGEPSILVLDEATSALDSATEKKIDDALRRRGCTCLIVAHRLSTIRDADEIVVMQRGKVVQRGTHDEMKAADGAYARLIEE